MKKLIVLLLLNCWIFASEIPVNISNDIYPFLFRMENRNILSLNAAVYPLMRSQIAALLKSVDENRFRLSDLERALLDEFLADYRRELTQNIHKDLENSESSLLVPFFSQKGLKRVATHIFSRKDQTEASHLFTLEKDHFFMWGDASLRFEQQYKNQYSRLLVSDRYLIQGGLNEHLFFHIDFFRYQRDNNPDYPELTKEERGIWTNEEEEKVTFDNIYSSMVYHNKNLNIGLYHQPLTWGTSFHNSMILTGSASPFTYLGFDYTYKAFRFSFFHGSLLNDSTGFRNARDEVRNREKYIAGHRIDLAFFGGHTRIGLTEMIIYGNRNVEPGYLLPVNFYWSLEHTLMDRDNSLMAFDFQTNIVPNFVFYGTFFLDEMRFSELFNQWWANKHGLQMGVRFSNELISLPMNWTAEMTRIRPWTYTHKYFINNYTNNGLSLGFPYGGNSQLLEFFNETRINRRTQFKLGYTHLKHGYDTADNFFGGDPRISYEKRNPELDYATKWLMGDIQTIDFLTFDLQYEIYNDSYIYMQIVNHFDNKKDLFINLGMKLDF
ncbi:MAG: hypothetical protein JXQ65_13290 [Candidatus Marinimicrobia bacterium]|nr:hypothetical protein [Candidatus Neomarinimicrobiota bacterium]